MSLLGGSKDLEEEENSEGNKNKKLESICLPSVLYGCEAWTMNE